MRIISGKYKGKRLVAPKKLPVRPTTDFAKEALFNILNNLFFFDGITVLDLFAGTGNISYEFASRGVQSIIAVDAHYGCVSFIKRTASELEFPITTVKSDVYQYLSKASITEDIIFADPPYDFDNDAFTKLANLAFEHTQNDNVLVIIEHSKHTKCLQEHPMFLYEKRYGGSVFSFLGREE